MLRIAGVILVIAGCVGIAAGICGENRQRLRLLKQIRSLYETMKYYIAYQRATIPETLYKLAMRKDFFLSEAFMEIYRCILKDNADFEAIWKTGVEKALKTSALKKQDRELLLGFPACLGYMEEKAQAGALDELLRETNRCIEMLEQEEKSNSKMIMSLGMASGVLISILLL